MAIALLTFGAVFGCSAILLAWIAIRGYRLYREVQIVTCPQNGVPVAVKLHAVRAILARSYQGAHCALCRVDIGEIGRGEHKPVLMSPDRKTRIEWDEVAPQELPKVLSTHSKICWNCHMEESFRTLRPNLATRNPSRRGARRSFAS